MASSRRQLAAEGFRYFVIEQAGECLRAHDAAVVGQTAPDHVSPHAHLIRKRKLASAVSNRAALQAA